MRLLPNLAVVGAGLPLPDATAEGLIQVLLDEDSAARLRRVAEILKFDPALLLWVAARCPSEGPTEAPSTVDDFASILNDWLPGCFVVEAESDACKAGAADDCVSAVISVVATAAEAARLAKARNDACAETAYLVALLHGAGELWASNHRHEIFTACLSPAMATVLDALAGDDLRNASAEAACVADAIAQGDTDPAAKEVTKKARQHWTRVVPLAGSLSQIARCLHRLSNLEAEFARTLESEKLQALYKLAAGAGHEINNPLGSIAGRAQLLLRDETDPEKRRTLAKINAQAFRAHEMIADMMLFAKPPEPVREPVDLHLLVKETLAELSEEADERETSLACADESESVTVSADRTQLQVVLRAMCVNALEAIGAGGHVEIAVRQATDSSRAAAEIMIRDNGPGVSQQQRKHIFDPFYSGREAGRGLGFGLSKCWRIVTSHGGRIDVDSSPGHGATFKITLPAA